MRLMHFVINISQKCMSSAIPWYHDITYHDSLPIYLSPATDLTQHKVALLIKQNVLMMMMMMKDE